MYEKKRGMETGHDAIAQIEGNEVSLDILPDIGVPQTTWKNNGWELLSLKSPTVILLIRILLLITVISYLVAESSD